MDKVEPEDTRRQRAADGFLRRLRFESRIGAISDTGCYDPLTDLSESTVSDDNKDDSGGGFVKYEKHEDGSYTVTFVDA